MAWDYTVDDRCKPIKCTFKKETNGIMFVYDITNRDTFRYIYYWLREARKNIDRDFFAILIGNKCDLESERKVLYSEGQALGKKLGLPFFETSALVGTNVDNAYSYLIEKNFELLSKFKWTLE
ncbi:unnamed protein product [Blepharisma stoltei]|uniref:Uncharacterized protein n=1 Tax=Blepharisma stoltei TaxID=1481888 RepID=A0AAU9KGB2_9CILI|nr:unnamed protein product [Blepharisma stoltei]